MKKALVVALCAALVVSALMTVIRTSQCGSLSRELKEAKQAQETLRADHTKARKELEAQLTAAVTEQYALTAEVHSIREEKDALAQETAALKQSLEDARKEARESAAARLAAERALAAARTETEAAVAAASDAASERLNALRLEKEETEKRLSDALAILLGPSPAPARQDAPPAQEGEADSLAPAA